MPERPNTRDEIDLFFKELDADIGLPPPVENVSTLEDQEIFWADKGIDLSFKAQPPGRHARRAAELRDGLSKEIPDFNSITTDDEKNRAIVWSQAVAALENVGPSRNEFESNISNMWKRFVASERKNGFMQNSAYDNFTPDQMEQVANFQYGDLPLHVRSVMGEGVVTQPGDVGVRRETARDRWSKFYNNAFQSELMNSRFRGTLAAGHSTAPQEPLPDILTGFRRAKETGSTQLKLSDFFGYDEIFSQEFMAERKETILTGLAQAEVQKVENQIRAEGQPLPEDAPQRFQEAVQRIQNDPSQFKRNVEAIRDATVQGLSIAASPFMVAVGPLQAMSKHFGLTESYRNWQRENAIAWNIMMAPDKEQGINYVAQLEAQINAGIESPETKKERLNEVLSMGNVIRQHVHRVRGNDPDDTDGLLAKSQFLAKEMLGTAIGDPASHLPDLVMAVAPLPAVVRRARVRARMKKHTEAIAGEVMRKAEDLQSPRARAEFLEEAIKFTEEVKDVKGAKSVQKSLTRLHESLNRLKQSGFVADGIRNPHAKRRMRDLNRRVRELDPSLTERAFDVVHPDRQPLYKRLDTIDSEMDAINRAILGEDVEPVGTLTKADLENIRMGVDADFHSKRIEASAKKLAGELSGEYARLYQLGKQGREIRAIAKDALDRNITLGEEAHITLKRHTKNLDAMSAASLKAVEVLAKNVEDMQALASARPGQAFPALEKLKTNLNRAQRNDAAITRTYEKLDTPRPTNKDTGQVPFEPKPNMRATKRELDKITRNVQQAAKDISQLREQRVLIDDMLQPDRLREGAVLTDQQVKVLELVGKDRHSLVATNLNEAARAALEIDDGFVPDFAEVRTRVPENLALLNDRLIRDTIQRAKTQRSVEKTLMEAGWWELRQHELSQLPLHEQIKFLRGQVRQSMATKAAGSVWAHELLKLYEKVPFDDRVEIFEALRSKDPEALLDVYNKHQDVLAFRDQVYTDLLTLGRKFNILTEAEFEKFHGKPYVRYTYNPAQFKESIGGVKVPGREILPEIDPSVLKHRLPEDVDLLVYENSQGKQLTKAFDRPEAAKEWATENLPGDARMNIINRWGPEERNLHGLQRDVQIADLHPTQGAIGDMNNAIAARGLLESMKATNMIRPLSELDAMPARVRQNYVTLGEIKDRLPVFEPIDGAVGIHKDALWEVVRFNDEAHGFHSLMNKWHNIVRDFKIEDIKASGAGPWERLKIRAGRLRDRALRAAGGVSFGKDSAGAEAISTWKMSRIPLSYTTSFVNYVGNATFAYYAGHPMTPRGVLRYVSKGREFVNLSKDPIAATKNPIYQLMRENGMIETGGVENLRSAKSRAITRDWESAANRERLLQEAELTLERAELDGNTALVEKAKKRIDSLQLTQEQLDGAVTSAVRGTLDHLNALTDKAVQRYSLLDSSAKYAVLDHLINYEGMLPQAAIKRVRNFMQDFTQTSGNIKRLGRGIFTPVPSFQANVFRIMYNNLAENKARFFKPFLFAGTWNMMMMAGSGMNPEEFLAELDTRRRWRASDSTLGAITDLSTSMVLPIPSTYSGKRTNMMMNWQELQGLGMFSSQNFMAGESLKMMTEEEKRSPAARAMIQALAVPASNMLNGPGPQIASIIGLGRDPMTGRSVDSADGGYVENWHRRWQALAKMSLPAGVPGTWQYEQAGQIISKEQQVSTGQPRDPLLTALNLTGLPARAWTQEQLSSFNVYLNAEEDGRLNLILEKENNRMRELKKMFPNLETQAEKAEVLLESISGEAWDAAGKKVSITPKRPDLALANKLRSFSVIGAARMFKRMSQVAKIRTIADHQRMGLSPSSVGPLIGEWLTEQQMSTLGQGPDDARDFATLFQEVPREWLQEAFREGAKYKANFGRR
jgi:hypothetical protein